MLSKSPHAFWGKFESFGPISVTSDFWQKYTSNVASSPGWVFYGLSTRFLELGWVPQESRCLTNLEWNEMRILGPKCIVFNHWVLYKDKCLLFKTQDWLNSNLVNGWSSKIKLTKFSLAQAGHWLVQIWFFFTRCHLISLAFSLLSLYAFVYKIWTNK